MIIVNYSLVDVEGRDIDKINSNKYKQQAEYVCVSNSDGVVKYVSSTSERVHVSSSQIDRASIHSLIHSGIHSFTHSGIHFPYTYINGARMPRYSREGPSFATIFRRQSKVDL